MKIVYITGCLGFIGSYVTRLCLEKGWYIHAVDKIGYASNIVLLEEFSKYPNFVFEKIDINDIPFLKDCDYIINCAASTHVSNSIVESEDFIHDNIQGVYHLLELIRKCRFEYKPTLFQFGTDEEFGDGDVYHKETDILKPSNPYAASKCAASNLILGWSRTYDIKYIILRPTNNFGKFQNSEKLIPKTVKYLNLGRKIPLHDFGKPYRTWLCAEDTAKGVLHIIDNGITNEIYNISGGYEQSNYETIKKIITCYNGYNIDNIDNYILHFKRPGQDKKYLIDDTKLRNLGWKPLCNFDEKLPEIVEFYKNCHDW